MTADRPEDRTLGALHAWARSELRRAGIATAALDARLLLQAATGCDHADLIARPQSRVPPDADAGLRDRIARRIAGESVFRILGWREFYGLRLRITAGTLEPRPDTETLVDHALPLLRSAAERSGSATLLDLGCGSGAIALALLAQESRARAIGVDISEDALATARCNAAENGLAGRFKAIRSRWFDSVEGRFDLLLSNPPYIATRDIGFLEPEVRLHDPRAALDGGPDGLDAYREISGRGLEFLAPDGHLLVEIGAGQLEAVQAIFEGSGFALHGTRADLQGSVRSIAFRAA